jgi:hypothetical protein
MYKVISGALFALAMVVTLFFVRFYVETRDRLFLFFAVSFAALGVDWLLVAIFSPVREEAPYYYLLRLVAFLILIIGIYDKNRDTRV